MWLQIWIIFKHIILVCILSSSCEIMLLDHRIGDKSTLVQVVVWCRQAASHNLNQCSPIILYSISKGEWVNSIYSRFSKVPGMSAANTRTSLSHNDLFWEGTSFQYNSQPNWDLDPKSQDWGQAWFSCRLYTIHMIEIFGYLEEVAFDVIFGNNLKL